MCAVKRADHVKDTKLNNSRNLEKHMWGNSNTLIQDFSSPADIPTVFLVTPSSISDESLVLNSCQSFNIGANSNSHFKLRLILTQYGSTWIIQVVSHIT